jgi:hypothetical protein
MVAKKDWNVWWRARAEQFVLSYRLETGEWREHRIPREFRHRRDAERYAAAWLDEMKKNGDRPLVPVAAPPDRGPTIRELAPRWLDLRQRNPTLSAATKAQDASVFEWHALSHAVADVPILELGPAALRGWVRHVRD